MFLTLAEQAKIEHWKQFLLCSQNQSKGLYELVNNIPICKKEMTLETFQLPLL